MVGTNNAVDRTLKARKGQNRKAPGCEPRESRKPQELKRRIGFLAIAQELGRSVPSIRLTTSSSGRDDLGGDSDRK